LILAQAKSARLGETSRSIRGGFLSFSLRRKLLAWARSSEFWAVSTCKPHNSCPKRILPHTIVHTHQSTFSSCNSSLYQWSVRKIRM